jgi:hypothetical protein
VKEHLERDWSTLSSAVQRQVQECWRSRWAQMDSPLIGAAYCLDPQFWADPGITANNTQDACVSDLFKVIDKLLPDEADRQAAHLSFASFRSKEGCFAEPWALQHASLMPAHQWWQSYGMGRSAEHACLRRVAMAVLSQPTSACSCERAWSAYDFIHNRRRNRLLPRRAEKLVYCFTNMRLITKMQGEEQFHGWCEEEEQEEE